MQFLALIFSVIALFTSFTGSTHKLGAAVTQTASSDTLNTFRTNVNSSLSALNTAVASAVATSSSETKGQLGYWTTTSGTPAALSSVATGTVSCTAPLNCTSFAGIGSASTLALAPAKGNFIVGDDSGAGQATSTVFISSKGLLGLSTSTPFGLLSINPTAILGTSPQFVVGSSTATSLLVTPAGRVGVGSSSPAQALGITGKIYASQGIYFNDGTTLTTGAASGSAFPLTQVFSGAAPTVFTNLDLSSVVGAASKMVFMKVARSSGAGGAIAEFKKGAEGATEGSIAGSGVGTAAISNGEFVYMLMVTNGSGIVQWLETGGDTITLNVEAYW